ncbi:hypothetical protein PVAP13_6NG310000 [Panicum virgatum]|nr:hypothetical protein PVAP13_6NG310000 [Panicum virgatum]
MAGRFVSHKFVSGICRSTSRLTARASPSARATDPIVPRALEAGIRNNSNVFHGAAVQSGTAVPNNCAIHSYAAARYLGTSPWSCAATKAGCPTTGMPSTVIKKPTFPVSVGGMKRTYSSGAPNKLGHSWGAKLAAWRDRGSVLKLRIAKKLGP